MKKKTTNKYKQIRFIVPKSKAAYTCIYTNINIDFKLSVCLKFLSLHVSIDVCHGAKLNSVHMHNCSSIPFRTLRHACIAKGEGRGEGGGGGEGRKKCSATLTTIPPPPFFPGIAYLEKDM